MYDISVGMMLVCDIVVKLFSDIFKEGIGIIRGFVLVELDSRRFMYEVMMFMEMFFNCEDFKFLLDIRD